MSMTASALTLCAVISYSGAQGEPLACGYARGHQGAHSWATLPTFLAGSVIDDTAAGGAKRSIHDRIPGLLSACDYDHELEALTEWVIHAPIEAARELVALRAVVAAADGLRYAWDALCRCVDEFEPEDMAACCERRDDLDTAILAVLAARQHAAPDPPGAARPAAGTAGAGPGAGA